MLRFLLRRLGASILLLFVVLTATFFIIHIAPGDPLQLFSTPRTSPEQVERLRQFYGLDQPLSTQYFRWLGSVLRGDWGFSITSGRAAGEILIEKLPASALLALAVVLVEHLLGVSLGLAAAARAGGRVDRQIRVISLLLYAVPAFWLALLSIEFLSVRWPIFPTNQMTSDGARYLPLAERILDLLHHLVLPACTLGVARCGAVVRFVRNGVLEVLDQDYIRTAYAKGLTPARILWVHALRNAIGPLIQRFGLSLPSLLGGALIIEVIFSWPGFGQAIFTAILERDYPVILASTAISGVAVVLGTLLADLLHAWIDPRVRHALETA